MYLTASLASSEQQTATLLVHIASTSPASVSTTEELARLHAATRAVTMHLEQLVEERDAAHDKLAKLQTRRDEAEAKRELMALEFVLGWEKQKREAAKKARKGVEV
ncbi:hypothetical protein BCR35DRAFT_172446 [Leucosporidium creatinivorum]|uniref:Uncharacterized protein n=1 Tax=Leucosporidium creatinivorum TaxID=106004 RepID=A0A1Y2E946_9BASI|nr:hypothetical protein BCR35DRAFT_172446 [Leucosporidium creatinivorum]